MSNNAPDYNDNLVFPPQMPRCDIEELKEENQQLKELLKECREKLKYCVRETYELQTKIDEVLK